MEHSSVKAVLVVLALLLVAAVGSSKMLGQSRYLGLRLVAKTSLFFLIFGAIVGPSGLGLLEPHVLAELRPVVIIGLGWIGFLYGSHLDYRELKQFRAGLFWTAYGEALVTFALVGGSLYGLCLLGPLSFDPYAIVLLASTAACTAPLRRFTQGGDEEEEAGATYRLAHFCSRLDDLPGLCALGFLFSIRMPVWKSSLLSAFFWFAVHIVLGLLFGIITHYLYDSIEKAEGKTDPGELTVVFFGMLAFTAGFSAYLGLSPLFVGVVSGVSFANFSVHNVSLGQALAEREHTVFVLFLLVSGCNWPFRGFQAWIPLVVYLVVRVVGKFFGSYLARRLFLSDPVKGKRASEGFGLALIPQGGMAIAMVMSYMWTYQDIAAPWAINVVHIGVIVNDLIAPYVLLALEKKNS